MKAVVLAYHNTGCVGIRALLAHGFDIQAVFTHEDDPNENIWFESAAELAASNDIPVYAPADINHAL
jgi:UDP-4-amino-4-deoxy-L-arabinose formyltransferase / UDP-glucuronic acid dehydrogenase (UDP-4-keto-hexauronic acid decarboxylating)